MKNLSVFIFSLLYFEFVVISETNSSIRAFGPMDNSFEPLLLEFYSKKLKIYVDIEISKVESLFSWRLTVDFGFFGLIFFKCNY